MGCVLYTNRICMPIYENDLSFSLVVLLKQKCYHHEEMIKKNILVSMYFFIIVFLLRFNVFNCYISLIYSIFIRILGNLTLSKYIKWMS